MPVSHEIKSQLAKLLATEDLIVEHRQIETAQFNVHTRVLTLPVWDKASSIVYDMLVGHEVGHALFTPDEDWLKKVKVPHQFVNVVEDARIERLMKRKYAGISKTFFRGYKELHDEDFFSISDESIADLNLADRANLYFKIGNFVDIPFDTFEETLIVQKISNTETFDDVLRVAEELYLYCKKQKEEEKVEEIEMPKQSGSGEEEQPEPQNDFASEESDIDSTDGETSMISEPEESDEPEVQTADSLAEKLQDLVSEFSSDSVYVEIPQLDLNTVIAKNVEVHKVIDEHFDYGSTYEGNFDFKEVDTAFRQFKKSAQKEVNFLVKEFECRKAADSYARSNTARTGVLDCSKLHTYKYNEDLFKKVTTLADGKNHGLVFVLDWSGSMNQVMLDTIKQLYNLIWFCKKVSIPFEVYAFTNEWCRGYWDLKTEVQVPPSVQPHYKKKAGLFVVSDDFSMMNILTSKTSSKELERQMINIWRVANYFSSQYRCSYHIPDKISLSGTPLNEALCALHSILPHFQKESKVQKVQCIVLTDGEANHLPHHVEINRRWDTEPYVGARRIDPHRTFLRDRKLGTTYAIGDYWHHFTDTMLRNLKDKFKDINFIGIRVLVPRDAKGFMRLYDPALTHFSEWKKERSFCIKNSGYHAYFGLSSSALAQDVDFEVDEGATKSKIKSAFAKSLKTKKLNKKVLGEFISLVA